jgi:hypothetical protein
LIAAIGLIPGLAMAIAITVSGNWSLTIGQGNLQGGAGSDLTSTYTSATNQATMGVSGTTSGVTWRIDILRIDTTWDAANLHLWVKRTNNGTSGAGTYSGGTSFLEATLVSQTFMTGSYNRTGFTLQNQITGVSVSVVPKAYSTSIRYTLVQTN